MSVLTTVREGATAVGTDVELPGFGNLDYPTITVVTSLIWFGVGGVLGVALPALQMFGGTTRLYYSSMTAHGVIMIFGGVFQLMAALSLVRASSCLEGVPGTMTAKRALYVVLNLGVLTYFVGILMGTRASYVMMFPLPLVGVKAGIWSRGSLVVTLLGLALTLVAVSVLYPVTLLRTLLGGTSGGWRSRLGEMLSPEMLGMSFYGFWILPLGVAASPVILSVLLRAARIVHVPFLTTPKVFEYTFWVFSHNLMEAMGVMVISLVYALVPMYTKTDERGLYSRRLASVAMVFAAASAAGAFFHHLYTATGTQPATLSYYGQLSSWLIGLGASFTVFNVSATVYRYGLNPSPGILAVLGGFGLYVVDGFTAVQISTLSWNFNLHGTTYITAHAMTIMTVVGIVWLGALYHYYPVLTGKFLDDRLGYVHVALTLVSTVGLYVTLLVAGVDGMPRRLFPLPSKYAVYLPPLLVFGVAMAAAQVVFVANALGYRPLKRVGDLFGFSGDGV
ncbi:MAG: cbb3-type cytochrome c oxidase subunit I [Halobacteria archaeon]|nr:cbb3-type cytochrome c oxidase subunit I [Halobacteria archaeon]